MMFKLRNDKNEEFEVTAEQLATAGIRVVPDGSTVIGTAELTTLQSKVTNLSTRVEEMTAETLASKKSAITIELHAELDRLSNGALVTKATRDQLEAQFKDATDLTAFKALTSTFVTPVIKLNTEHGSGADGGNAGEEATQKIIKLADEIVKEKGVSLREATIQAGMTLANEAEAYHDRFMPTAVGG